MESWLLLPPPAGQRADSSSWSHVLLICGVGTARPPSCIVTMARPSMLLSLKAFSYFMPSAQEVPLKIVIICLLWFKNASAHHTNCRQCYALAEDSLEPELDAWFCVKNITRRSFPKRPAFSMILHHYPPARPRGNHITSWTLFCRQ